MPELKFKDKTLECMDCGRPFEWSAGEQAYYFERDLTEPRRCKQCRDRRRSGTNQPRDRR